MNTLKGMLKGERIINIKYLPNVQAISPLNKAQQQVIFPNSMEVELLIMMRFKSGKFIFAKYIGEKYIDNPNELCIVTVQTETFGEKEYITSSYNLTTEMNKYINY